MSRIRPPLTTSMTVPSTTPSSSLTCSIVPQRALVLGALLGQDQPALLVLLLEDQGLDLVADLDDLVGVDVVLDRQLTRGDDALGLVADVEQDLVAVDLDDGALDDVAVVEVLDGRVDRGEEVFFRPDVVDGHLGRVVVRKSRDGGCHKGGDSLGGQMSCGRARGPFHYRLVAAPAPSKEPASIASWESTPYGTEADFSGSGQDYAAAGERVQPPEPLSPRNPASAR